MTTVTEVLNTAASAVPLRRPLVFDLVAHFEPSAHYRFSRRVRNEFDRMAKAYSRSTWLLGRYGGRPVMQSDIQGIGVASRVEIGRLVLREGNQLELLASALRMFRECQDQDLASGSVSRILVHFNRAEERHDERKLLLASHQEVFGDTCAFRTWDEHALELGHCVEYQTLIQYLREDGLYHSTHRNRVDQVQRHLSQEVGRYENHKFFVLPQEIPGGGPPSLKFFYTGDEGADARGEAVMEGYTQEKL
ncbi:MAG: hypothetical protein VX733_00035, partial [Candidatus Latescibacterota bacterium]|nr:hypothetical protein [Candidatus Latescibacterota bacterium]